MDREDLDDLPHTPPVVAKENLIARYRDHGISVHIDDGTAGYDLDDDPAGGGPFTHNLPGVLWQDPLDTLVRWNNEALFAEKRRMVFHYGVYAHLLASGNTGTSATPGRSFQIGNAEIQGLEILEMAILMHEFGHNVLGSYCNDVDENVQMSCPGYPDSPRWNQLLAHFDQTVDGFNNDVDDDSIEDQFWHYSGDVMCTIEPCSQVYVVDFSPETWMAVSIWRSL
jgi:hypothetical protein